MNSENLFYIIAELFRNLMPYMAALGTLSSIVGFWRMFRKWNRPGYLSLLPFARGYIFGKDSSRGMRLLYSISDGMIMLLTPVFYYVRAKGGLTPVEFFGFTVYVDASMIAIVIVWAILEVTKFLSSVNVSTNLCKKNNRGKLWIVSWVLMPQISKILWGFSDKIMAREDKNNTKSDRGNIGYNI